MIEAISTNIKDSKQLQIALYAISKKYNGLHYKMSETGCEIYINNDLARPAQFEQDLNYTLKEVLSEVSVLKIGSVEFLPPSISHFRDDLVKRFNELEDKSIETIKNSCAIRYHALKKRIDERFMKSVQKTSKHKVFSPFAIPNQDYTFADNMNSRQMNTELESEFNVLEFYKEQDEQKIMAEQERTFIVFFKLNDDFKSGIIKEENLLKEWINCFSKTSPSVQFAVCADDKDEGILLQFKCNSTVAYNKKNNVENLWIDINLITSQIKRIIFGNKNFGNEQKVESSESNIFSIRLTTLVVSPDSKESFSIALQKALIEAGLENIYNINQVISTSKPSVKKQSLAIAKKTPINVSSSQADKKESGYITDEEEENFLEKTTRDIVKNQQLESLSDMTWKKIDRRVREFSTINLGLFKSVSTLADALKDQGIVSSFSFGINQQRTSFAISLNVTLKGKH